MNVKSLLLLLAFTGFGVSCNNEDLGSDGPNVAGGRTELQVLFSGTGESQDYTKATATESENRIDKLEIHLFAANALDGTYYYLETWNDGTAYNPVKPEEKNFKKSETGTGWKASLYPNEVKGLPYVKLMCVVNNGASLTTDATGTFFDEDGTTKKAGLVPVTATDVDENGVVTGNATTEADFRETFTPNLGADPIGKVIATPLVMTGDGSTKISGSVSKVNITLRRIVARFDIENDKAKTNFTINKVSLGRGRINGTFWESGTRTEVAKGTTSDLLTDYQSVEFGKIAGANSGITESAFYSYSNLATDESFLILEGLFKSPMSSLQIPVTYNVPIQRIPQGANQAVPMQVKHNNRYHLKIMDVTQSNVFASFEVVDWTSGGGINVKPDNDAPVFTGLDAFIGNKPKKLPNGTAEGDTCNYEVIGATGKYTLQIAATGEVRFEKTAITKAEDELTDWLKVNRLSTEERDGVWYSKFEIIYDDVVGKKPVAVTFINDAASFDPALWTTLNFYAPKAVPEFAILTDKEANSKGNLSSAAEPTAPTASLYNATGSYVTFDITSIEGIDVAADTLGYTITKTKTTGFVHTYKIAVKEEGKATDGKISFRNAGDGEKKTELTVTQLDPSLKFTQTETTGVTWVTGTETPYVTTGELKIDLDALTSYTFQVKAPQGLNLISLACPWLTITESHKWTATDGYAAYTITKKGSGIPTNIDDFNLVFTNTLSEKGITAPALTIKLHKDFGKPQLTAGSTTNQSVFNVGLPSDFTDTSAPTITMYKAIGSKIAVKMACGKDPASFEEATGLTVTPIDGSTGEYEISIADQAALDAIGETTTLTARNTAEGAAKDRIATLTITWLDPTIKVTKASGTAITDTDLTGIVNVNGTVFAAPATAIVTLSVTGPVGSTIAFSDLSDSWISVPGAADVIPAEGSATITIMSINATNPASTADVTLTLTNKVKNVAAKVITFHKE